MYPWSNTKKLKTLHVSGNNQLLSFETPSEKAEVYLKGNEIEKVVCTVKGKITTITKDQSHVIVVGEDNWQRDVFHFLKPNGPAPTLRVGFTRHRGLGTWSSLPHDFELRLEPDFEEVFFHMLEGGSKRAIQLGKGVWYDNTPVDACWFVKDHSLSTIPMGYHPVVGEPHVQVSYVWVYLAKKKSWEKM